LREGKCEVFLSCGPESRRTEEAFFSLAAGWWFTAGCFWEYNREERNQSAIWLKGVRKQMDAGPSRLFFEKQNKLRAV
jgi:hypothetical protein